MIFDPSPAGWRPAMDNDCSAEGTALEGDRTGSQFDNSTRGFCDPAGKSSSEIPRKSVAMVDKTKEGGALRALNAILVLCRSLAHEGRHGDLAIILDVAEYLPLLMMEPDDRTDAFREQLVELARRYPAFALAVERFDAWPS